MPIELTQQHITQSLSQQASDRFGQEQAEHLHPQLEEHAAHLWLIARHPPGLEDEPAFVCTIAHHRLQEQ